MSRLEEIRARVEAAAPGPWFTDPSERCMIGGGDIQDINWTGPWIAETYTSDDSDFIAHAREDVPYLLSDLARVTAERDEALETLRGVRECIELFDHTAVYDLKSDLLAILEGDTE